MVEPKPQGIPRRDLIKGAGALAASAVVAKVGEAFGVSEGAQAVLDPAKDWATVAEVSPASQGLISRAGISDTHEPLHQSTRIEKREKGVTVKGKPDRILFDPNFDPTRRFLTTNERVALSPNGETLVMGVVDEGTFWMKNVGGNKIENRVPALITRGKKHPELLVAPLKKTADDRPDFVLRLPGNKAVAFDGKSHVYAVGGSDGNPVYYANDPNKLFYYESRDQNNLTIDIYGQPDTSGQTVLTKDPVEAIVLNFIHDLDSPLSHALAEKLKKQPQDVKGVVIQGFSRGFADRTDVAAVTNNGRYVAAPITEKIIFDKKEGSHYLDMVLIIDKNNPDQAVPILASDFPDATNRDSVKVVGTHDNNIIVAHTNSKGNLVELGLFVLNAGSDQRRLIPIPIPNDAASVAQYDTGFVAQFYDGATTKEWILPLSAMQQIQAGTVKSADIKTLWQATN